MTDPTLPPSGPDGAASYAAAADEYAPPTSERIEDDDDETDEGDGSGGDGKGGPSRKDYEVALDPILDFSEDADLSEHENALKKLDALGISPMSLLVSGGSAFASENDLSRKVFLAGVGLVNLEIKPRDIADPKLIIKLDGKQAERRAIFGIKTLDEIVTGAVGSAAALVGLVSASVTDYVKDKKEERKIARQIREFQEGKEDYGLDSDDYSETQASLETADFPVQYQQGVDLVDDSERHQFVHDLEDAAEDRRQAVRQLILTIKGDGTSNLPDVFQQAAEIRADEPVQKVTLKDELAEDIWDFVQTFEKT